MKKKMILTGLLTTGLFATGMGISTETETDTMRSPVGTELYAEEYVVGALNAKPGKVLEAEASERAIKLEPTSTVTPVIEENEEEVEVVVEPTPTPTPTPTITEEPESTVMAEPITEYSEEPEPTVTEEVEVVEEEPIAYVEAETVIVEEEPVIEEEEVEVEVEVETVAETAVTESGIPVSVWDEIAECESGGDWTIVSADGRFRGGVQFELGSWDAMGGQEFAVSPEKASKAEQIAVAERLQAEQGWGAWPVCSAEAGLR